MYVWRNNDGSIKALLAKITEDLLNIGSISVIQKFADHVKRRFEVSTVIIDGEVLFNGCHITQSADGDVKLSLESYLSKLRFKDDIEKSEDRNSRVTAEEVKQYRGLSGEMVWFDYGVLPQAAYYGSYM